MEKLAEWRIIADIRIMGGMADDNAAAARQKKPHAHMRTALFYLRRIRESGLDGLPKYLSELLVREARCPVVGLPAERLWNR